jgi:hypothetical protein
MVKCGVLFEVRTEFLNIIHDELRLQRVNHYFKKFFELVYKKRGYGNFNFHYNVFIHLHAILGVGNFTKVVRVCVDRL